MDKKWKIAVGVTAVIVFLLIALSVTYKPDAKEPEILPERGEPQDSYDLILPINFEDANSEGNGIWPFGVQGGEHPHGHPGIDFESYVGKPVLASGSGRVGWVGDSGHHNFTTFSITYGKDYGSFYTGNLDIIVKQGDLVAQGDIVAYFSEAAEGSVPGFHFDVHKFEGDDYVSLCPADFMRADARAELEVLFNQSKYQERDEFPLLCNPCPPGGCY